MSDFARLMEAARAAGVTTLGPPIMVDVPYVSPETAAVGAALNCTMGNWNGEPSGYSYSWQRLGNPAEIGTGASYTTVAGDADTAVHCVVTATNGAGSTVAPPSNSVAITATAMRAAPAAKTEPASEPHASTASHTESRRK